MEAPLLEGVWQDYKDAGNVHIVNATNFEDWAGANGPDWRTGFTPNLTYWLALADPLYNTTYFDFGNMFVPYNIIISGKYKLTYSVAGYYESNIRAALDEAIPLLDFDVYVNANLENIVLENETFEQIDITDLFVSRAGNQVNIEIINISNPDIATVELNGNTLDITTTSTNGFTEITLRGSAGNYYNETTFTIENKSSSIEELYLYDFEDSIQGWTVAGGIISWMYGQSVFLYGNPTMYMAINSQDAGSGYHFQDTAYSPVLDLSDMSYAKVSLFYGFHQRMDQTEDLKLAYRTSPDEEWTPFYDLPQTNVFENFTTSLPQEMLVETAQLGVFYDDHNTTGRYAAFDDVLIEGVSETSIGDENLAVDVELYQNYPNPFNPETTIEFRLNKTSDVSLSVYNAKGEIIKKIFNENMEIGLHKVNFSGEKLNSGIYFYKLNVENMTKIRKMLLVK